MYMQSCNDTCLYYNAQHCYPEFPLRLEIDIFFPSSLQLFASWLCHDAHLASSGFRWTFLVLDSDTVRRLFVLALQRLRDQVLFDLIGRLQVLQDEVLDGKVRSSLLWWFLVGECGPRSRRLEGFDRQDVVEQRSSRDWGPAKDIHTKSFYHTTL
jgi:hypothetical protein